MTTFWERAAHSVYNMFVFRLIVILVISQFGFESGTLLLPILLIQGEQVETDAYISRFGKVSYNWF